MSFLYICESYLTIDVTCNKKMNVFNEEKSYEDRKVIYTVCHDITTDIVHINVWNSAADPKVLLFTQDVKYIKNQRYTIYYKFDKNQRPFNFEWSPSLFKSFFPVVTRIDNDGERKIYECVKKEDPVVAKKEFKKLLKSGLITYRWSGFDGWYVPFCEACHVDGSGYVDGVGRVYNRKWAYRKDGSVDTKDKNGKTDFIYNSYRFEKIPSEHWDRKTFYNKRQFEILAEKYKPILKYYTESWLNRDEFEAFMPKYASLDLFKKFGYDEFDKAHDFCGNYWRDPKGEIICLKDKNSPVIGAYEPVVLPNIIKWKLDYDFDLMWEKNHLAQCEIDEDDHIYNDAGGAWRFLGDGQKVVADESIEMASHVNRNVYNDYEKVVSPGWHNAYIKDSVACPVCERTYELISAVDVRTPIQKLLTSFRTGYKLRKLGKTGK